MVFLLLLNRVLSVRPTKKKKVLFYFHFHPSLRFSLSLYKAGFLAYIIIFPSKKFILIFFTRHFEVFNFYLSEKVFISPTTFEG